MIPGSSTKKFSSEAVNVSKWVPRFVRVKTKARVTAAVWTFTRRAPHGRAKPKISPRIRQCVKGIGPGASGSTHAGNWCPT